MLAVVSFLVAAQFIACCDGVWIDTSHLHTGPHHNHHHHHHLRQDVQVLRRGDFAAFCGLFRTPSGWT